MKIALVGYGKMGRMIEEIAINRGHMISYKISSQNQEKIKDLHADEVDIAIEFTQPDSALHNYKKLIAANIPIVTGTTGWHLDKAPLFQSIEDAKGSFFYASNFSIGMNIFFQVNKLLAKLMNGQQNFEIKLEEVHHLEKKDSPSGTAITIAHQIIDELSTKNQWNLGMTEDANSIPIFAHRKALVFGDHSVHYSTDNDEISITHKALNRKGFALGAVLAAEWIQGKKGIFTMEDMLNLHQ